MIQVKGFCSTSGVYYTHIVKNYSVKTYKGSEQIRAFYIYHNINWWGKLKNQEAAALRRSMRKKIIRKGIRSSCILTQHRGTSNRAACLLRHGKAPLHPSSAVVKEIFPTLGKKGTMKKAASFFFLINALFQKAPCTQSFTEASQVRVCFCILIPHHYPWTTPKKTVWLWCVKLPVESTLQAISCYFLSTSLALGTSDSACEMARYYPVRCAVQSVQTVLLIQLHGSDIYCKLSCSCVLKFYVVSKRMAAEFETAWL